MSGGSQHNPNGRQSQLGPAWSPLQLQVASFLSRAPQAHLSSERGVTWHTPTPPPHLYHVPVPSPPDPLQGLLHLQAMAMKGGGVYRHTATPPDIYRHTPTPPDKHLIRHTPSPGDIKTDLYPHLGPGRDKRVEEESSRGAALGVDLSVSRGGASPAAHPPALSVRDAPTINSLIARAQPRTGHAPARVDSLLERLAPAPVSPHSVIVAPRAPHTPSPPSSEDSADSTGTKRKRKPDRTVRVAAAAAKPPLPVPPPVPPSPPPSSLVRPLENGDTNHEAPHDAPHNGAPAPPAGAPPAPAPALAAMPARPPTPPPPPTDPIDPPARRKSRSGSAETIDDIAAMIASTQQAPVPTTPPPADPDPPVTIDKLESVLASPKREPSPVKEEKNFVTSESEKLSSENETKQEEHKETEGNEAVKDAENKEVETPTKVVEAAAAPRRRSARTSTADATNVPVQSPSEARPAEPHSAPSATQPAAASFVEVENQLEQMFAGLEEAPPQPAPKPRKRPAAPQHTTGKKRRGGGGRGGGRGARAKWRGTPAQPHQHTETTANATANVAATSTKAKGPYIQIKGPSASPVSVSVKKAAAAGGEEEDSAWRGRARGAESGARRGLHASTLGLRYDATTPDRTWLCAFCQRGPHAPPALGDLFGPYRIDTDCDEYRSLDEATRRRYESGGEEVWVHEACAVWAPGVVAAGARVWGLAAAVWAARPHRCPHCARPGPALACHARHCRARAHLPCARTNNWTLDEEQFRAFCPRHE